jgi:hypothetical protein
MKRALIFFCFFVAMECCAGAQTATLLDTIAAAGGKAVILPTYDNLFKLLKVSSKHIAATLQQYNYAEDEENPGTFAIPHNNIRKEDKEVYMFYSVTADYVRYFEALEDDIKKRFPDVKHETAEHNIEVYGFTVRGKGKDKYYNITIIKDRTFGCSAALHEGHYDDE